MIKERPDDAEDYTVKLSEFLRYSVESHKNDVVTVAEELRFVDDYLALQKVRFDNSFACNIAVPNEVLSALVPVFSLQTLVENAFKHNYFTEVRPLRIGIGFGDGKIHVTNNKVSMNISNTTSTGLTNPDKRCQLITGKPVEVTETENEFSVALYPIRS